MKAIYRELLKEVRRFDPAAAARLRPGLPAETIKKKLATLPYQITSGPADIHEGPTAAAKFRAALTRIASLPKSAAPRPQPHHRKHAKKK
jgi:hypothetical protein